MGGLNAESRDKKIGWTCSYVPEEMILAAGLEPVRIQGRVEGIKEADGYVFSNLCPYVKNLLDSGLNLKLDDMAGIIFANSCDGMRRLHDLWSVHVATPFIHMLEVPKNRNEGAVLYFADRLLDLKNKLECVFGVEITDDKLNQTISLMNERRRLVTEILEGQREDPPRYRGSQLLSMLVAEATQPKNQTTVLLKDLANRPAGALSGLEGQPRIMIMGNLVDRPALFEMVENARGSIVVFDTCNGFKHYADPVKDSSAPLEALARRYLLKPSCARMPGFESRLERLEPLIRDYSVQGVSYSSLKFCDYSLFETPQVERLLKAMGLPFLTLENDYVWGDLERLRTRVEAFLEMAKDRIS